ncbi:MAG: hypothetical protein ACN4GR_06615 [Arenicellales bacterium]
MKTIGSIKFEGMEEQALTIDPQRKVQDAEAQQHVSMSMDDWVKFVEDMFENKITRAESD